jgi:membrane protein YdbS with pleckstrin-like domain
MRSFKPSPSYTTKLRVIVAIVSSSILLFAVLLAFLLRLDNEISAKGSTTMVVIFVVLDAIWSVPAILLSDPYRRSLSYEIQDDEVVVRGGIWTRSVKHVPYRTVTNLTVNRGLLDRVFGLGTLDIQTAGMSGSGGAEQSLVGLEDPQEVYALVAAELRRFRGAMAPTAAEMEEEAAPSAEVLNALLAEVRAIRRAMEED